MDIGDVIKMLEDLKEKEQEAAEKSKDSKKPQAFQEVPVGTADQPWPAPSMLVSLQTEIGPEPGRLFPNLRGTYPKLHTFPATGEKGFDLSKHLGMFVRHGLVCVLPFESFATIAEDRPKGSACSLSVPDELPSALSTLLADAAIVAAANELFRNDCRVLVALWVPYAGSIACKYKAESFMVKYQARLDEEFAGYLDAIEPGLSAGSLSWICRPRAVFCPSTGFDLPSAWNYALQKSMAYAGKSNPIALKDYGKDVVTGWAFPGDEPAVVLGRVVVAQGEPDYWALETIGTWDVAGWKVTGRNFARLLYQNTEGLAADLWDLLKLLRSKSPVDYPIPDAGDLSVMRKASLLGCNDQKSEACPEWPTGFMQGVNYHVGGKGMLDLAGPASSCERRFPGLASSDGFNSVAFPIRVRTLNYFHIGFALMNRKVGWWWEEGVGADGSYVFHEPPSELLNDKSVEPEQLFELGTEDWAYATGAMYEDKSPSMPELRQFMALLGKQKLDAMLRVYLSNVNGNYEIDEKNWRALVQPGPKDDWNKWWRMWFEGYAKVIAIIGKIAESLDVRIYDLGVELNSTVGIVYYLSLFTIHS